MNHFRSIPFILLCGFLFLGCAHQQQKDPSQNPTHRISNADIQWDGNIAGLSPTITGPSKSFLTESNSAIIRALIELLTDENRYIAAHVLLTHLAHEQFEFTANHWNDLRVEIMADNRIVIPSNQQPRLIKKWNQWLANTKQNTKP